MHRPHTPVWLCCIFLVLVTHRVLGCQLSGAWSCSQGPIIAMDFGISDTDDSFSLIANVNGSCTMFQQGSYRTHHETEIIVDLSASSCEITGNNTSACECYADLTLHMDDRCIQIQGPSGEHCVQIPECEPLDCGGAAPVKNNYYTPTTNGCGPATIPVTAPSFSFVECCNEHDRCYPSCVTSKRECDYLFYECMACSCVTDYDDDFSQDTCLEFACLYFQAVDNFGCGSYESSLHNSCACPGEEDGPRTGFNDIREVPSKFGPVHPTTRQVEGLFCSPPFVPTCVAADTSSSLWGWFGSDANVLHISFTLLIIVVMLIL